MKNYFLAVNPRDHGNAVGRDVFDGRQDTIEVDQAKQAERQHSGDDQIKRSQQLQQSGQ